MKCPVCQSTTKVINSRESERNQAIKRRRMCMNCGKRFTTYERIELVGLRVLKRDGSKEPYMRHKLELGLRKALEKRPYEEREFQRLVSAIESDIVNLEKSPVPSAEIGQLVLAHLKNFDKVAYIRFASVYRKFGSPKAFEKEIKKLKKSSL